MNSVLPLLALVSCSLDLGTPKSVEWVLLKDKETSKEIPYRFEDFDQKGRKVYDSTLFITGMGYKVNKYHNGLLTLTKAQYGDDLIEVTEYIYDDNLDLVKSITKSNGNTSKFHFRNEYNDKNQLVKISLFENGNTIPGVVYQRLYKDSLLHEVTVFKISNDTIQDVLKEVKYEYDAKHRIILSITKDIHQRFSDSVFMNYDSLTKWTFRKFSNGVYEVINREKALSADSTEIEILNPKKEEISIIKKKVLEYW